MAGILQLVLILFAAVFVLSLPANGLFTQTPAPASASATAIKIKGIPDQKTQEIWTRAIDRVLEELEEKELEKGAPLTGREVLLFDQELSRATWYSKLSRLTSNPKTFPKSAFEPSLLAKFNELRGRIWASLDGHKDHSAEEGN